MSRLIAFYKNIVVGKLLDSGIYKNKMQVPRLEKITLNMGIGSAGLRDKKIVTNAIAELSSIAGQQAVATKARKSNAGFKIRDGWIIGCKVTLRREVMYTFLDKLVNIALPRVRDFRGISVKSFDGFGNYNLGIHEHSIFPEIEELKIDTVRGLDIAFTTTARTDEDCFRLLSLFNFPFKQK